MESDPSPAPEAVIDAPSEDQSRKRPKVDTDTDKDAHDNENSESAGDNAAEAVIDAPSEDQSQKRPKVDTETDKKAHDDGNSESAGDNAAEPNPYLSSYETPAVPPQQDSPAEEATGMLGQEREKHGVKVPVRPYGPADTKLWTKRQADMFRNKKATAPGSDAEGRSYASKYMRWWFSEHAGQPIAPQAAPRSAYTLFVQKRSNELGCSTGNKKLLKKIGAEWKAISESDQAHFNAEVERHKRQRSEAYDIYEQKLSAWRKSKRERLIAAGCELSNEKRIRGNINPICNCILCEGDDHEEPVADP